jgi:DNA polymerase III delta prime subunit
MTEQHSAWDELIQTLYSEEGRIKIEWAIGAMVEDSRPKTLVFCGPPQSGKTTILNIIRKLSRSNHLSANGFPFMEVNTLDSIPKATRSRCVDVRPTGNNIIPELRYVSLVYQVGFELESIARHCAKVYREKGESYYDEYTLD